MASDNILKHLKNGEIPGIKKLLQDNLGPVLHNFDTLSNKQRTAYGMFAIQFLYDSMAACDTCVASDYMELVESIDHCCLSLESLKGHVKLKDPLTMQKVLLNVVNKLCKADFLGGCLVISNRLLTALRSLPVLTETTSTSLAHNGYLLLWKKAYDLQNASQDGANRLTELALRECAIDLLAVSRGDPSVLVERTSAAVARYSELESVEKINDSCCQMFHRVGMFMEERCRAESVVEDIVCSHVVNTMNHVQYQLKFADAGSTCNDLFAAERKFVDSQLSKPDTKTLRVIQDALCMCEAVLNLCTSSQRNSAAQSKLIKAIEKSVVNLDKSSQLLIGERTVLSCVCNTMSVLSLKFDKCSKVDSSRAAEMCDASFAAMEKAFNVCTRLQSILLENLTSDPDRSLDKLGRVTANLQFELGDTYLKLLVARMKGCSAKSHSLDGLLSSTHTVIQSQVKLVNYGVTAGLLSATAHHALGVEGSRIGSFCSGIKQHRAAADFLQVMCSQLAAWCDCAVTKEKPERQAECKLWKRYVNLAYAQAAAQLYPAAAHSLVCSLRLESCDLAVTCDCWIDLRREAMTNNGGEDTGSVLENRTLCDFVQDECKTMETDFKAKLLMSELSAQRGRTVSHKHLVVDQLLTLESQHRAYALTEKAALMWLDNDDLEKAAEFCQEAITMLEQQTAEATSGSSKKSRRAPAKVPPLRSGTRLSDLARAHFWLYFCENKEPGERNKRPDNNEVSNEQSTSPTPDEDTLLSSLSVTLHMEHSSFDHLDQALDLWEQIAAEKCKDALRNASETISLLGIAISTYSLAKKVVGELRAIAVLHSFTKQLGLGLDSIHCAARKISLLLDLGCVSSAQIVCESTERDHESLLAIEDAGKSAWTLFKLAKARLLMYSGKVKDSWDMLETVQGALNACAKTKVTCYLNGLCQRLRSRLCRTPSLHSLVSPPSGCTVDSAWYAFNYHSSVVSSLKTGCKGDSVVEKWSAVNQLLTSLLYNGAFFISAGDERSARCYLREGLRVSQSFNIPRRIAEFLLELARLDNVAGKHDEAEAKLSSVHFLLNSERKMFKERKPKPIASSVGANRGDSLCKSVVKKESDDCFGFDESYNSEDDDFISSRPVCAEEEAGIGDNDDVRCDNRSSPMLKTKRLEKPGYMAHTARCQCEQCSDLVLHTLNLKCMILQAEVDQCLGLTSQSGHGLEMALQLFKLMSEKATSTLEASSGDLLKGVNVSYMFDSNLVDIYMSLAGLSMLKNMPQMVRDYISKAESVVATLGPLGWFGEQEVDLSYLYSDVIADLLRPGVENETDTVSKKLDLSPEVKAKPIVSSSSAVAVAPKKPKGKKNAFVVFDDSLATSEAFKTPARPKATSKRTSSVSSIKSQTPALGMETPVMPPGDNQLSIQNAKRKSSATSRKVPRSSKKKTAETMPSQPLSAAPILKLMSRSTFSPLKVVDTNSPEPRLQLPRTPVYKKHLNRKSIAAARENVYDYIPNSDDEAVVSKSKARAPRKPRKTTTRARIAKAETADPEVEIFRDDHGHEVRNDATESQTGGVVDGKSAHNRKSIMPVAVASRSTRRNREKLRAIDIETDGNDDVDEMGEMMLERDLSVMDQEDDAIDECSRVHGLETGMNEELMPLTITQPSAPDRDCLRNVIVDFNDSIEVMRAGSDDENCRPARKGRGRAASVRSKKVADAADSEVLRSSSKLADVKSISVLSDVVNVKKSSVSEQPVSSANDVLVKARLTDSFNRMRHHPPSVLYRNVCHSLALLSVSHSHTEAAYYLTEGSSVTFRHMASASIGSNMRKLRKEVPCELTDQRLKMLEECREHLAFNKTVDKFTSTYDCLLPDWTVCQLSVLSTAGCQCKRLVISRLRKGQTPLVVQVNDIAIEPDIVAQFQKLMVGARDVMLVSDKATWWSERHRYDKELKSLVGSLEDRWLGCWKGALLGYHSNSDDRAQVRKSASTLAKQFGAKGEDKMELLQILVDTAHHLTSLQLNDGIRQVFDRDVDSCEEISASIQMYNKKTNTGTSSRQPVILVLDKDVQALPWESLPVLRRHPVCRVPSLYFIRSHLRALQHNPVYTSGVDTASTFYILDPESNLPSSRELFSDWFQNADGWTGVIGRQPTKEEFREGLTAKDLFLYCGHGSGTKFYEADKIPTLHCRGAALLIGCSSGRLQVRGQLEADGVVQKYLIGGCPCVLGNLWDVTDKDIDRFTDTLLKTWLPQRGNVLLPEAVALSRDSCKVSYLVGAAPVIYGLPVVVRK